MAKRTGLFARFLALTAALWLALVCAPGLALAAPDAAMVMDARTGQVLHAQNADARLHPASLTKMMTLYVAFDAIRRGEIGLDTMVTVSARAAGEPPSRLGLRAGQRISLRNLIRAAAIKSANDAATAIGEAIAGSEAAFARRMTATALAIGMRNSTFRNAHGLTEDGQLSTARDMTVLGRRLFYDFPDHYALFSRLTVNAGVATVQNTNRRFLESYRGADGIKTGFTRAAGFNLTASAERGNKRLVATVFGASSLAARNARMSALLDRGFEVAPARVATQRPAPVDLPVAQAPAQAAPQAGARASAKTIRLVMAPARSLRPLARPGAPAVGAPAVGAPAVGAPALAAAEPAAPIPFQVVTEAPDAVAATIDAELRDALADEVPAPRARPAGVAVERPTDTAAVTQAPAAAAVAPPAVGAAGAAAAPTGTLPAGRPAEGFAEGAAIDLAASPAGLPPAGPRPADPMPAGAMPAGAMPAGPMPAGLPPAGTQPSGTGPVGDVPLAIAAADPAPDPAPGAPDPAPGAPGRAEPVPGAQAEDAPVALAAADAEDLPPEARAEAGEDPAALPAALAPVAPPVAAGIVMTAGASLAAPAAAAPGEGVMLRLSSSGARYWGVSLGRYASRGAAERALLQTGLAEGSLLGGALRKVVPREGGFEATFAGLTADEADLACRRLAARAQACATLGP